MNVRPLAILSATRLQSLLAAMPKARVAVAGDFCLDVYWFIDRSASETSLETGKPTLPVREQRCSLGGAGNVVANLVALGVGQIHAVGVVGRDPFGERLVGLLKGFGVNADAMLCAESAGWQTLAYCKPYVGEEELSRLDMGNFNALPDSTAQELVRRLEDLLPAVDLVIVNQQVATGIHTPCLRRELRGLMQRHPDRIFVYDGRQHVAEYPEAWLKVNDHEALRLSGVTRSPAEVVLRAEALESANALCARTKRPVFVTRGARGGVVCTGQGATEVPGLLMVGATDPVGAGDSYLAGICASLAAKATPEEAAQVGNFVAGVTVAKLRQTGTASPAEVLQIGLEPQYIYDPELAEDPRQAKFLDGTEIEIIDGRFQPPARRPAAAIFDHDGTISTLRQGWEEVMEPMMVRAILGARFGSADEALYHRVVARVRAHIDQTTGVQTLIQMQGLVGMVREFGLVPATEISDESGYKAIYNQALMARVRQRLQRLVAGELSVQEFTLRNAIPFLQALHWAGVRLYLASGTDQADVEAEARALGYAGLFEGRIYGAVGDVTCEAKRMVLDRILKEVQAMPAQIVTFGDGPVEIRETQRRGGLAIGVASDEVRRFDSNKAKRARLIRAGAAVIIPDFSQMGALVRMLKAG